MASTGRKSTLPLSSHRKRGGLGFVMAFVASLPASAQFSRYADEIELKRLDHHPRGSYLRYAEIYGTIDLGIGYGKELSAPVTADACAPGPAASDLRVGGLSSSLLGVRAAETLDRGWRAHAVLEHGLNADTGCRTSRAGLFWDRQASVGLSHQDWGRLDVGRLDQPAWAVALLSDPWSGGSVASPGDNMYYRSPSVPASAGRQRSSAAISYASPERSGWTIELQRTMRPSARSMGDGKSDPGLPSTDLPFEWGAALRYRSGGWQAGLGWQRWDAENRALPVAAVYTFNQWRGFVGATLGRTGGREYRNLFVGATLQERSGPRPPLWRMGLDIHHSDGEPTLSKLGAGQLLPFSRRTALQWNVAATAKGQNATRPMIDIGLRHTFTL